MADLIIGDDYPVNPVEAFVFGCSVLLHDSALAVAAYEGGLEAIKASPEWRRSVETLLRQERLPITDSAINSPPQRIERPALFTVLRSLHAAQAATMLEREWKDPDGQTITLLDDSEMRSFYGHTIGRIAHSHHWGIDKVAREFQTSLSVYPKFPPQWSLNELKVAAMLRCADAAHIDRRRATTIEFALTQPQGISEKHWRFQHKLGIPTIRNKRLLYTSSRDFGRKEAEAWWLCFDTCGMISREIITSNAILKEAGVAEFDTQGVEGVERARLFARYVKPDGWVPVDAEVRVSDPVHLARTLGGPNLYGTGYAAPVRELLQNGLDSTLLREGVEHNRGNRTYKRRVRLSVIAESDMIILRVEDNGVGMSERVLTGGLIDFGSSLWQMQAVESGAMSPFGATSGKFGIGFFSVFLLGERVRVESRPFASGLSDALTLEFSGLSKRPIVVPGAALDFPIDFSTRIDVYIKWTAENKWYPS
jgi:hypothetical protein